MVPAAGVGRRMGGALPKQYRTLLGKTVLEHSLGKLLATGCIEKILVALSPEDAHWPELACAQNRWILAVTGGRERAHSVLNALKHLQVALGADASDWVLVHDAARPCVRVADIKALLAETDGAGAILASPVSDTVKKVTGRSIESTLDRSRLWAAQTPQMFRLGELLQALSHALMNNVAVTDEASAMELAGPPAQKLFRQAATILN